MSRKAFICGNWKMHKTQEEALGLLRALQNSVGHERRVDTAVFPPYPFLAKMAERLDGSCIQLGAQEVYPEDSGAFTGAVSAPMLKSVGVQHVLVGHSERRQIFGETLASSNQRMRAALRGGLLPMLCIGENLEERDAGKTLDVVGQQMDAGLEGLSDDELKLVTIAYEPVWAIGTGKVATPGMAQEVHAAIRERLRYRHAEISKSMRLLYGGSVKPKNAQGLLAEEDIDGALVGGASLKAEDFVAIVKAALPA